MNFVKLDSGEITIIEDKRYKSIPVFYTSNSTPFTYTESYFDSIKTTYNDEKRKRVAKL